MNVTIRNGKTDDVPEVLKLIKDLAIYEKALDEVETTVESMIVDCFGEKKLFDFIVAELDSNIIGTAVYFSTYSTWKGRVLYLEDLIVQEEYRRSGIGKKLLDVLINIAVSLNCKRMSWQVLDWNEPAIEFYKKIGAAFDDEWINCKLTYDVLQSYKS